MDGYQVPGYIDNRSILVMKSSGTISRLYCPFRVRNNEQEFLTVSAVAAGTDGKPYYLIDGTYYRYSFFQIIATG